MLVKETGKLSSNNLGVRYLREDTFVSIRVLIPTISRGGNKMKKVFAVLAATFLMVSGVLAEGQEIYKVHSEEFTWSYYEILCWKNNKEPSYSEYLYLVENPQCYGDDSGSEILKLLKNNS